LHSNRNVHAARISGRAKAEDFGKTIHLRRQFRKCKLKLQL